MAAVPHHTPTDMAAELEFLDSIKLTFKHMFPVRRLVEYDGEWCAEPVEEFSLDLPTGALEVNIKQNGNTTTVLVPGLEFELIDLGIGSYSAHWRYELKVRDSLHCYIDEREARWLLKWALPMEKFLLFVNLSRPEGAPHGPIHQFRLGEVSNIYDRYVVYDGKNRANPAAGTEIVYAYYYPKEQCIVYTCTQCCGEYPCRCADVCENTVRIVRLTSTGQEILLDWAAYDTKTRGTFIKSL